ncbi:MAG: SDR family oxidoreductase [Pseudomonadota bacterium]
MITGGNRGLGAALVATFTEAGWNVVSTARGKSADMPARVYQLDLSDAASVDECASAIKADGWVFDLLIHNAGFNPKDRKSSDGYFQSTFSIEHFSAPNIAEALWINALMPMALTSRLLPALSDDAAIVGVSSWLGSIGGKTNGGHYGYAGSKALLNMFLRGLALEFGNGGRTAVAVNPGWMRTDMGGGKADISPHDVAKRFLALAEDGQFKTANGSFINTDGSEHPW